MFSRKTQAPRSIATLIGSGTLVRGDVLFKGGLHLEGRIVGDVSTEGPDGSLTVGEQGVVEGSVQVGQLVLNGTITGDVSVAQRAELGPTARVEGNLRYNVLEMAGGARVNGRLIHDGGARQALPAPEETSGGGVEVDDAAAVR
jgi:cytoskeletal protein CcmA (bactofilin family)